LKIDDGEIISIYPTGMSSDCNSIFNILLAPTLLRTRNSGILAASQQSTAPITELQARRRNPTERRQWADPLCFVHLSGLTGFRLLMSIKLSPLSFMLHMYSCFVSIFNVSARLQFYYFKSPLLKLLKQDNSRLYFLFWLLSSSQDRIFVTSDLRLSSLHLGAKFATVYGVISIALVASHLSSVKNSSTK
jgi:hypothetical protein